MTRWLMWVQENWAPVIAAGLLLVILLALNGCATMDTYRPMIDTRGVDLYRYEFDLNDCRTYAEQVPGTGTQAAVGAVAGAVAGALIARLVGRDVERGAVARVGAATGAAQGAVQGYRDQRDVVRNCLRGRGYAVLH